MSLSCRALTVAGALSLALFVPGVAAATGGEPAAPTGVVGSGAPPLTEAPATEPAAEQSPEPAVGPTQPASAGASEGPSAPGENEAGALIARAVPAPAPLPGAAAEGSGAPAGGSGAPAGGSGAPAGGSGSSAGGSGTAPTGTGGAPEALGEDELAACTEAFEEFAANVRLLGPDADEILAFLMGDLDTLPSTMPGPGALQSFLDEFPVSDGDLLLLGSYLDELAVALEECLPELVVPAVPAGENSGSGSGAQPVSQPLHETYYANCDDARAKGATNIPRGTPGYRPELDSDSDGIGCEQDTAPAAHVATASSGQLAYTGVTVAPMVAWGAALVLTGGGLTLTGRRRS